MLFASEEIDQQILTSFAEATGAEEEGIRMNVSGTDIEKSISLEAHMNCDGGEQIDSKLVVRQLKREEFKLDGEIKSTSGNRDGDVHITYNGNVIGLPAAIKRSMIGSRVQRKNKGFMSKLNPKSYL